MLEEQGTRLEGRDEHDGVSVVQTSPTQVAAEVRTNVVEEFGRAKRKRVPRQLVLDGCLCGSVLDGSMDGVLRCKQAGCETQWVSLILSECYKSYLMTHSMGPVSPSMC